MKMFVKKLNASNHLFDFAETFFLCSELKRINSTFSVSNKLFLRECLFKFPHARRSNKCISDYTELRMHN